MEESFKAALTGKIDSWDKWVAIHEAAGYRPDRLIVTIGDDDDAFYLSGDSTMANSTIQGGAATRWWIWRELYRQRSGVYASPTPTLELVSARLGLRQWLVHISREDPTLVAYTPSPDDGARDKQVRLSLGKLLRKLCPLLTDAHIQRLEAMHRAESDPTFLVAESPEDIERVYTTMEGDSGCMRYAPSNFDLPDDIHPSHAYSYPGLGVAYVEIDGRVMSRSVIYDNPDDPKDKRYVRIYGDPCLKRKLELAGYRQASLQGAKLRRIEYRHYTVVPYIDGPGGNQHDTTGCYGYSVADEDCVHLIDQVQAQRLAQVIGKGVPRFKSTSVLHHVPVVPRETLEVECALTGVKKSALDATFVSIWKDGKVQRADEWTANGHGYTLSCIVSWADGDRVSARIQHETPHFYCSEYGLYVLDTESNRIRHGWRKLSSKYGYAGSEWHLHADGQTVEIEPGHYVLTRDTAIVFDANGEQSVIFHTEVDARKKSKEYLSCAPYGSRKVLSHRDNTQMVLTRGKKRCVRGLHGVMQLVDGTWDYVNNAAEVTVMDRRFWVPKDALKAPLIDTAVMRRVWWDDQVDPDWLTSATVSRRLNYVSGEATDSLQSGVYYGGSSHTFSVRGDMVIRYRPFAEHIGIDNFRKATAIIRGSSDQDLLDMGMPYIEAARMWAHHADIILTYHDELVASWTAPAPAPELDDRLVETAEAIRGERIAVAAE